MRSSEAGSAWEGVSGFALFGLWSCCLGLFTYCVGTVPAFGGELVDEHEADVGGSVYGRFERTGIPVDDRAVSASFSLQSIQRCVDECRGDSSRSTAGDQSAVVRGARDRSAIGLVGKEQASEVSVVEVADARNSQCVFQSEAPLRIC